MNPHIRELFDSETVVARRDNPALRKVLGRLVTGQEIESVLPGVYARRNHRELFQVRVQALSKYDRDAILMGRVAARLSFWPEIDVTVVQAAVKHERAPARGFAFVRRKVPVELVTEANGIKMTTPALTALDLCLDVGGDGIDEALRRGSVALPHLHAAMDLIPGQPGNGIRRQYLLESSDNPWSAAERLLHGLLREAGITGWQGNAAVLIDGREYIVDALFRRHRLAIEVDGRAFHGDARFETDRRRQNMLVLDGWRVLRFTWRMLESEPGWVVEIVQRALGAQPPARFAA